MAVTVASLKAVFTADTTDFDRKAGNVRTGLDGLSSNMRNFGQKMGSVGLKLTAAMAPAALAIGFSVRQAIRFESAFAGVEKTVDATDAELATLRQTIKDMATDSENPLSSLENAHTTLAGIMEVAGQLGVPKQMLVGFTQTMGELGMATDLTAEEAATLSARFGNITGMDFSNVDRFGATIVDLGNNSATTESEILNMGTRIAAAGTAAGLSEADILGFSAALSSVGLSAQLGGGNFSRFINSLNTAVSEGGPLLGRLAEVSGMTATEFKRMFDNDPTSAITNLVAGLGEMDQSDMIKVLEDMGLAGSEMTDVIGRLSGNTDLMNNSLGTANNAWRENTALTEEAAKRANTTEGAMNRMKNQINGLAIEVGDALLPAFNSILEALSPLITKFAEFAAAHPDVIVGVSAITLGLFGLGLAMTILGPIVTGLAGLLAFGGAALSVAMGAASLAAGALSGVLAFGGAALTVALGLLLSPIGAVALGLAAGALAFVLFKDQIDAVIGWIENTATKVIQGLVDAIDSVTGSINEALGIELFQETSPMTGVLLQSDSAEAAWEATFGTPAPPGIGSNNTAPAGGGSVSDNASFTGHAGGTSWTGFGPRTGMAGFVHNQEAVVPAGGMSVIPSPRGLMLQGAMPGGGGPMIMITQLDVHGVQDVESLYDDLSRVARQRA